MTQPGLFTIIIAAVLSATPKAVVAEGLYVGAGLGAIQIEDEGTGYSVNDIPPGSRFFIGFEASRTIAFEGVFFTSDSATQSIDNRTSGTIGVQFRFGN